MTWPADPALGPPGWPAASRVDEADGGLHVLRLTPYYYLLGRELSRCELQYEPIGGMQVQIAQITEELDGRGVRQSVVLPRRPGLPGTLPAGRLAELRLLRLLVAPIRTRSKGYIGLLLSWGLSTIAWSFGRRLRRQHRRYSLIHVHCSELPWTFVVAVVAARLLGRPLVLTTHCSAIATFHPETLLGRLLIWPARIAERYAVRRAAAVIVLTERIRRTYVETGLTTADRVHVIPDGVRLAQFHATPGEASARADGAGPLVLYCGRFAPEKGWVEFVDAARLLTEAGRAARYVMCGDGNELDRCRRRLARAGLADRVELPGHLDRDSIARLMRRATVVVVPSRHEELGGTVLEALASGRAVVATNVGGLPEVVVDGVTGLLAPPWRADLIADAVARLLDDPELRARLGEAGPAHVLRYDAALVAESHHRLYQQLSGRPRSGQPLPRQPLSRQPLSGQPDQLAYLVGEIPSAGPDSRRGGVEMHDDIEVIDRW